MRENIELIRRAMEALGRRPKPDFETINALYHPDHVFVPADVARTEVLGGAGYRDWLSENVLSFTAEFDGAIELGPRTVLAQMTMEFHGEASEIDVEQRLWLVANVANGLIARTEAYVDPDAAVKAAGLGR